MKLIRSTPVSRNLHGYPETCDLHLYLDYMLLMPLWVVYNQCDQDYSDEAIRRNGIHFIDRGEAEHYLLELTKAYRSGSEVPIGNGWTYMFAHDFYHTRPADGVYQITLTHEQGPALYIGMRSFDSEMILTGMPERAYQFPSKALAWDVMNGINRNGIGRYLSHVFEYLDKTLNHVWLNIEKRNEDDEWERIVSWQCNRR